MVDFPIRVVIKPDAAIAGARQVTRVLTGIEGKADRLRKTIKDAFSGIRLRVDQQSINSAGIKIRGVTDQVNRLRKQAADLNRVRLSRFERNFPRIARAARTAGRSVTTFLRNTTTRARAARLELGGLRSIFLAIATGATISGVVNLGRGFQNLNRRIRSVSDGAADTRKNLELVRRVSEETGTSIATNAQVFARLTIATRQLGLNATRTIGIVKTLSQSLVVGGATVPWSTKRFASSRTCATGRENSAPRVYGTTQKVQNLSQPSCTDKNAETPCGALSPGK